MTRSEYTKFKTNRDLSLSIQEYAFPLPLPTSKFLQTITNKTTTTSQSSTTTNINRFNPSVPPPPMKLKMKLPNSDEFSAEKNESSVRNNESWQKKTNSLHHHIPIDSYSNTFLPINRRPLVHVFMIPERMGSDVLECMIDCLMSGIQVMHSDIQIILLSYSNIIGVYNLQTYNNSNSTNTTTNTNTPEEEVVNIKYASFIETDDDASQRLNDLFTDEFEGNILFYLYYNILLYYIFTLLYIIYFFVITNNSIIILYCISLLYDSTV
jgi:hypothetical protein